MLADAEAVYRRWGATPRADALLAQHGELFRTYLPRAINRVLTAGEVLEASLVTATSVDPRLDLSSAIKAAETFAGHAADDAGARLGTVCRQGGT